MRIADTMRLTMRDVTNSTSWRGSVRAEACSWPGARQNLTRAQQGCKPNQEFRDFLLQTMTDRPQVREERMEQRLLEELDAERSSRARLVPDRALDELDVPVSPLLHPLVEVGHQLEQDRDVGPRLVEAEQRLLDRRVRRR